MPGELPRELAAHIAEPERSSAPPGWHPLLLRMHAAMLAIHPDYKLLQVKEKFGGLRVYLGDSECSAVVRAELQTCANYAAIQARETCRDCGGPGRTRPEQRGGAAEDEVVLVMCGGPRGSRTEKGGVAVRCDACEGE